MLGVVIGTALDWGNFATIALAIALAFFFGYSFTAVPLLRSGLALAAVLPIALAADTFSITVMEIVDNAIVLVIPGAMEAGLGDPLFWGSLAFALAYRVGCRVSGQSMADRERARPRCSARPSLNSWRRKKGELASIGVSPFMAR